MSRQCVILAGGLGTRLGDLTQTMPKPMLPVDGKPFLGWMVDDLAGKGFDQILILAGYLGDRISDHFTQKPSTVDVQVLIEPEPMGTGGALRFALDHLDDQFLMLNGDTLFDVNYADLAARTVAEDAAGVGVALRHLDDTGRYGVVQMDGSRVTDFACRPQTSGLPGLVNGGVYWMTRDVAADIPSGKVSLEDQVFPDLAARGRLHARRYDRPFLDIGLPETYSQAQTWLPKTMTRPALFLDRDGVLNHDEGYTHRIEDFVWIDGAQDLVHWACNEGWHVFVVTNQSGVARGYYDEVQVQTLHAWMQDRLFETGGAITAFRYCPYHPDGTVPRYAKTSDWRKPGDGMLRDLMQSYLVDATNSLMIGDKPSDMEAASRAGLRSALFSDGNLLAFAKQALAQEKVLT